MENEAWLFRDHRQRVIERFSRPNHDMPAVRNLHILEHRNRCSQSRRDRFTGRIRNHVYAIWFSHSAVDSGNNHPFPLRMSFSPPCFNFYQESRHLVLIINERCVKNGDKIQETEEITLTVHELNLTKS